MYIIVKNESHKLFLPTAKARQYAEPMIVAGKEANLRYLAQHKQTVPKMPITGSFVYPHPPNYRGICTLHYGKKEWIKMLNNLKRMGMDTIILQAAVWNELRECYYPSKHFAGHHSWNVVEPMLEAAKETGLAVFLGGYGSVTGWAEKLNSNMMEEEKLNQSACYRELLKYRSLFDGFYFAPETAYCGTRDVGREKFLNELYREFFCEIKEKTPDMQILMSPATKYFPDKMEEMKAAWMALLNRVPLDIMAPQDSIGSCGNQLCHQHETYRAWTEVCRDLNIRFWSNIELFERQDRLEGDSYNYTASPERVAAQINNAAPYAEKLICWEAPYYLGPDSGRKGAILRKFLNEAEQDKINHDPLHSCRNSIVEHKITGDMPANRD